MERRTLKTKSGDVLLEFIDGYWIVYPIQPTYWRKDPQALRMMAQESNTEPSKIDQSKLKFESFHIIDLSKGFGKGTFDRCINGSSEECELRNEDHGEGTEDNQEDPEIHLQYLYPLKTQFGPLGFSHTDLWPFTDRQETWLQKMIDDGVVENPHPGSWQHSYFKEGTLIGPLDAVLEEEDFEEEDLDEEDDEISRVQGIAHSAVIKEPTRLFDLLFRWSDSGNRLVFKGADESDEIKSFITDVLKSVGESESLISSLDTLCSPRPIRILLPGLVEWTELLRPWRTSVSSEGLAYDCHIFRFDGAELSLVEEPISLSEVLLEWHPVSGFRLITRKTSSEWGWEDYWSDDYDEDRFSPATVHTSIIESVSSDRIETGEELFDRLRQLIENLCGDWGFQSRFTKSEFIEHVSWAGEEAFFLWERESEDLEYIEEKSDPYRYPWTTVSTYLEKAFPEIHKDFKRALETSNVSDAGSDSPERDSFRHVFKICLKCGYWSYMIEKCYLDQSELVPISDPQADMRRPGTEMTSPGGIEFNWIPSGGFMMGSPDTELGRLSDEGPQRHVTFRQGFWMGRYEVTQGQYETVMGVNPSHFSDRGKDFPVELVAWDEAKEFVKKLNQRNDGFIYSLPTEAEWEYAARAGTTTAFAFGNSLSSTQANFDGNYPYGDAVEGPYLERTTRVGSYRPNAWGLYDMHGNVGEWVEDIYQNDYTNVPSDGSAKTPRVVDFPRVWRGGEWNLNGASNTRSASRNKEHPKVASSSYGFRIVARAKVESVG